MCADLLTETCHDVCIEPGLHPLSGEQMSMATAAIGDDAHPDIGVADSLMYGYLIPTCVPI